MKKLKLFFACLLMAVLSIGQVWAATATSTLTFSAKCNGSGTADDDVAWTVTSDGTESTYDGTKGIHYGTSSAQVQYIRLSTSGISGTISQVVVNASVGSGVSATVAVKVGSTDFTCGGNTTKSLSTSATNYTFTGSASGDILVEITKPSKAAKALYCKSVAVTYDAGGTPDPTLESIVISGTPDKTVYEAGENFDPTGLVATGYYDNSTDADLTSSVDWAYTPAGALTQGLTSVNVTATKGTVVGNKDVDITVNAASPKSSLIFAAACGGSGTADDGAVWTVTSDGTESNFDATSGIHYGTNSANVTYLQLATSDISGEITKVVVNARDAQAKATISVTVGGTAFTCASATATNTSADYVFTGTGSGEIVVRVDRGSSMSKAIYVKSVVVTYVSDGKEAAGLAFDAAQKLAKVDGTLTAPNLSTADGFDGTVTYASSDEAVVKVNASTGAITEIVAVGKAVITAHSEATANFKEGSASYTIFVAEQAGTSADPLTEASAKALIDLGCTLTVHVNGLVLSQNSTNFTVTLTNGFQFYKAKDLNNVAFESAYLAAGDEVTAVGALKKFSSTYELDEGCYLTFYEAATTPLTPIANDKDHPYTVAQALAFAAAPTTYDITEPIYIAGVVYQVENFNSTNGTLDIYIKDASVENQFEFFRCKGIYGESLVEFTAEDDVRVGDEVIGYGVLKHFTSSTKDIWEFDNNATGDYLVDLNRPEVAVESVTLESTASVAVGGHVTLHAAVVPENASNKTINWSIESGNAYVTLADGVVTGVAEGTAVIRAASDEDASIYAECTVTVAPLSPWATVYTSNIELSVEGGTSASAAKVKFYGEEGDGYDALKAGTSGTAGAVVVNVPAGATALHFHAYSWYNETVELTVTAPTGVTVTPSTAIAINKNSGISGSTSTYELAEGSTPQFDAYYAVGLSGNSEPIALTISATSGKRFVLFGVNQVGGLVLESIAVSGTATELEYNDGEHFDPAGLSVIGHYSDASTAPITEGIVWAFDPDPLTEGTESVSVTATAGGFTSAAFVVDGLTVAGAAPLSPWATVYTSNVELSGSQNVKVTITIDEEDKNFDGVKMNKAAAATFTIPAGTTNLYAHMAAWNGEAQTVTVSGDCFDADKSIDIVADANISGSGTTYDIDDAKAPTDYFKEIVLDKEVTEPTEITITAASGKRFVLFGVNQVGGVVPVLDHIAITGTMTNTTGWKTGDEITPEGLTVNAYYTLNEVMQDPVNVTSSVVWSHAALVKDQTEVTLTATYTDGVAKSANVNVTIEAVETGDPTIITDPASYLNFGASVEKDAVVAPKTITVTLKNIAGATATLGGTNYSAFSIDDTEIVDGDVITVSVNTGTPGVYAGTVTIKDNESETEKVINLSMTVLEPEVPETAVSTTSEWVAAIDADLVDGAVVLITGVASEVTYAMGIQNDNNRAAVAGTLSEGVFTPGENTMSFTLVEQEENTFALQASNGEYLYAASSSKNYLKRQATVDGNAKWTLTATSAVANGENTHNDLKFNATNSPKIFSCYASGQTEIQFYVPKPVTPPTPSTPDYTRTVEINRYGTICLPNGGTISGATLFDLDYYDGANTLYLLQVNGNAMVAGRPYVFLPSATTIQVFYTDNANASAGSFRGLVGSYTQEELTPNVGNYILQNNQYWLVNSEAYVGANRAYIRLGSVPTEPTPQMGGAPRRRVGMTVHGEQTATGFENINASEKPMKLMIDGNIYILRGEKMYDATGRLVK